MYNLRVKASFFAAFLLHVLTFNAYNVVSHFKLYSLIRGYKSTWCLVSIFVVVPVSFFFIIYLYLYLFCAACLFKPPLLRTIDRARSPNSDNNSFLNRC